MSAVLGINAVFHDPAAAIVVDGKTVAAAEEERFSRRKHGKDPVPFSTWELPEDAIAFCLDQADIGADELDAIAYSYSPQLANREFEDITADDWEPLRTLFAERAPLFLETALPGIDPERVTFVPHHVAHAASASLGGPFESCGVLVLDGRGERASHLAAHGRADGELEMLAAQTLPDSLGLVYEGLTAHLGFRRSSDEYKVMALASYGRPQFLEELRELIFADGEGGFVAPEPDWKRFAPPITGGRWSDTHADLAASVQRLVEEVIIDLADWVSDETGEENLAMAGGVALNCVANSRLWREGPFENVWVQPAAGDAGTALGSALWVALALEGQRPEPMPSAALGPEWDEAQIGSKLSRAAVPHERPEDLASSVAEILAADGVVAWFQGRSEFGPRALGHRSMLADPRHAGNLDRLNAVKGREEFRPVAPIVLESRAAELFEDGPLPSPYMLFTHSVADEWRDRIPAVVHVDGTARVQTVNSDDEPLVASLLEAFEERTGVPVLVNTSLNTAGRPIVDDVRDALECFGSAPVDALVVGPFLIRRDTPAGMAGAVPAEAVTA